jgi:hypothetical protein
MKGTGARGIAGYRSRSVTVLRRPESEDGYGPGAARGLLGNVAIPISAEFRVQSPVSWAQSGESSREDSVGMVKKSCYRAFPVTPRRSGFRHLDPAIRLQLGI